LRAVEDVETRCLEIRVCRGDTKATIGFTDTGPGVADPQFLFQPFQPGAQSSGLGLYLSRAMVRFYSGELRYAAEPQSRFEVELPLAERVSGGT
jgi:signal transduction histidine kinase